MTLNEFIKSNKQVQIAKLVGVSQAMVSKWFKGEAVSPEKVLKLSEISGYKLKPHQIRPDLYPHPNDGVPVEFRSKAEEAA